MNDLEAKPIGLINGSRDYKKYQDYAQYSSYDTKYSKFDFGFNEKLSNVCYINSSIQCLFHLKKFVYFILYKGYGNSLYNSTRELLMNMVDPKKKILSVENIKSEMSKIDTKYKYNNQEDANEFISNFLDALVEETSHKIYKIEYKINGYNKELEFAFEKFCNKFYMRKGDSKMLDLFYGNYLTKTTCKSCESNVFKFSAFNMIELPIYIINKYNKRQKLDIDEILKSYFSESKIYEAICGKCHKKELYSRTFISKLPENLIIFFGRTTNDEYIDTKIEYSEKAIDLSNYLFNIVQNSYSLSGVIHYTSFGRKIGHYTASCKYKNGWLHFDDNNIYEINKPQDFNGEIILFYESI